VGPAPIPPHERHWRHPSELAPTAADVETPSNGRALVLATGTTALLLAAVMFVALTPSRSSAPTAVSATTLPSATIELQSGASQAGQANARDQVRTNRRSILSENGVALVGAPNAVSAAPVGDADDFAVAGDVPDDAERVLVLTASHAYDVSWGDIHDIAAPDGSIVMTRDGWLLATFVSGELRLLVN
jgi:hypothetical protein